MANQFLEQPPEEWSFNNKILFQQIKKTYKSLAIKYHPDKNSNPGSEEIFKKINILYDLIRKDTRLAVFAGKSKKRTKKKKPKRKKQTKKPKKKS